MKCSNNICHRPYSPPNVSLGEPYICRLAPGELSIELEWFDTGKGATRPWWYTPRFARWWYAKPAAWIKKFDKSKLVEFFVQRLRKRYLLWFALRFRTQTDFLIKTDYNLFNNSPFHWFGNSKRAVIQIILISPNVICPNNIPFIIKRNRCV